MAKFKVKSETLSDMNPEALIKRIEGVIELHLNSGYEFIFYMNPKGSGAVTVFFKIQLEENKDGN